MRVLFALLLIGLTLPATSVSRASIWPWKYGVGGCAARQKPQATKASSARPASASAHGGRGRWLGGGAMAGAGGFSGAVMVCSG